MLKVLVDGHGRCTGIYFQGWMPSYPGLENGFEKT